MRMTPVVVFVSFLLLLLTWLLLSGMNLNSTRFESELRALDEFSRFERGLNREVLSARVGLSRNYDALARMSDAYEYSLNRLREAAGPDAEESGSRREVQDEKCLAAQFSCLFWNVQRTSCRLGRQASGGSRQLARRRHTASHA